MNAYKVLAPKTNADPDPQPDFFICSLRSDKAFQSWKYEPVLGVQADVDDFTKLGVDPPGQEHNSFLSANFGHSAFKPLQWRFVKFFPLQKLDYFRLLVRYLPIFCVYYVGLSAVFRIRIRIRIQAFF